MKYISPSYRKIVCKSFQEVSKELKELTSRPAAAATCLVKRSDNVGPRNMMRRRILERRTGRIRRRNNEGHGGWARDRRRAVTEREDMSAWQGDGRRCGRIGRD